MGFVNHDADFDEVRRISLLYHQYYGGKPARSRTSVLFSPTGRDDWLCASPKVWDPTDVFSPQKSDWADKVDANFLEDMKEDTPYQLNFRDRSVA